ncbi:hypothetical protein JCM3765_000274 [Sporobolomyces pararoseus]
MDKPKRNKSKQISYVEVDSDVDLPSDEERKFEDQLDSKVNKRRKRANEDKNVTEDTTQTTTSTKKKKKSEKSTTRKKKQKYNSKMLLALPFDLFAELCTHLDYKDLISLAKVNKSLHKILLSRAARPIWAGIRKRDGFPLPEEMSELRFAVFSEGALCDGCGTGHVIKSKQIKSKWKDLHPRAVECVAFDQGFSTGAQIDPQGPEPSFSIAELSKVHSELIEAAAEDEIEEILLEAEQRKRTSRRKQAADVSDSGIEPSVSKVEAYVIEKKAKVAEKQAVSIKISTALIRRRNEASSRAYDRSKEKRDRQQQKRRQLFESYCPVLEQMGWSQTELEWFERDSVTRNERRAPKMPPSSEPEQWASYLTYLRGAHDSSDSHIQRIISLHTFYDVLQKAQMPLRQNVFPAHYEFDRFRSVELFLGAQNPTMPDIQRFRQLLPTILKEVDQYCQELRIEAIRALLAIRQDVSVTKFSTSPGDYPDSLYPDAFFDLAVSQFSARDNATRIGVQHFSDVGRVRWGRGKFIYSTEKRVTGAIQARIRVAGLDESTATVEDMDKLGWRFTWDNDPHPTKRDTLLEWKELIQAVIDRGPNKTKYKDGSATTIVSYFPQVDVDGMTYLDDEGDGSEDVVCSSEEEEEGEARRRGGIHSEGDDGEDDSEDNDGLDLKENDEE